MDESLRRIEASLAAAVDAATAGAPPKLAGAIRHAVFPGGARLRPRLCLAVASACGDPQPAASDAAAAAVELLHAASLVHDDLPCFDDAPLRRGALSVHAAFGVPIAVLAGDALITIAFETLARGAAEAGASVAPLVLAIARGVSSPHGIVAGQAWESEPSVRGIDYRRAKTGALFEAAAVAGALAASADPEPFRRLGKAFGEAYQIADDICDVAGDPARCGKPIGRDAARGVPNAANDLGLDQSHRLMTRLVHEAIESVPRTQHDVLLGFIRRAAADLLGAPSRLAASG